MKIAQLLKFISDLNPQNTPARLAFYNYLRHFMFYEEEVTPVLVNKFFNHAFEYPHWQANKGQLVREIVSLIENFIRFYSIQFPIQELDNPANRQIIELENFQDVLDTSANYIRSVISSSDKFRVVGDQNKQALVIVLKESGDVSVYTFDKKFTLRNGVLEPLRTDLVVHYDGNLELKHGVINTLELAPYVLGQFAIKDGKTYASLIRGYVFQKYAELKGQELEENQKLFATVKRLEQHFLDRSTDPYYLQLVADLKRLPTLLVTGDSGVERFAQKTLDKAELAFEEIFIGDKTLGHLIKELRHSMAQAVSLNLKDHEEWQTLSPFRQSDLTN